LGRDEEVDPWLRASQYYEAFSSLSQKLRNVPLFFPAGQSEATMQSKLDLLSASLKFQRAEISATRKRQDAESEHEKVSQYNGTVEEYNALLKKKNRLLRTYNDLDLAFNKCLDPAVLLTRFNQVDLTSETQPPAAEGDQ